MQRIVILMLLVAAMLPGAPEAAAGTRPSHLQVVAHPDDDLLFMNPDLSLSIRSGARVTTVFVTAGESDVLPAADYAASRQAGAHAAFAAMAGVADDWQRSVLELPGGHCAELHRLRAQPSVALVFLGLPDDNNPRARGGKHALTRLFHDPAATVGTVAASGSGIESHAWDRGALSAALHQLRVLFEPDLVRTHDPRPDPRYQQQWEGFHDHPDHVITARLVGESMPGVLLRHYRDYNTADAPPNLPARVVADKRATFSRYLEHDPQAGLGEPYASWLARMLPRRPWGSSWGTGDGSYAYVRGAELVRGDATGESVVDTPFVPREGSAVFADRYLFAQERETGEVFQKPPGGGWERVGAPPARRPGVDISRPAAVLVQDRPVIAVRDRAGGVSVHDAEGWCSLGGADVDEVAAVVDAAGEIHVLATTGTGLLRWRLGGTCGRLEPIPGDHHPVGALATFSGEHASAAFQDTSGDLVVLAARAGWRPVLRREADALSPPALHVDDLGRIRIASRNSDGRLEISDSTGRHVADRMQGQPAFDRRGNALALGEGGRILVRAWKSPGTSSP